MDSLLPKYTIPAPDRAWAPSLEAGAGIYLLEGRCHFAAHHSPAERALLSAGALHVANLRFDREPQETTHPERSVRPLNPEAAAVRYRPGHSRN